MKRLFDILASATGLLVFMPILLPTGIAIWLQDFCSPFYVAPRVGRGGRLFKMIKFRSMVKNADKSGVNSTGAQDKRITAVGHFVRRYKLDEVTQLWNVLKGDMSLVGPRPQVVKHGTELYTDVEKKLLTVRPGITDMASIVFADEGNILKDSKNPDLDYNRIIRPWKSRLALLYIDKMSVLLDIKIICLTILTIVNREKALIGVHALAKKLGADDKTTQVTLRKIKLEPYPPPGSDRVVEALMS